MGLLFLPLLFLQDIKYQSVDLCPLYAGFTQSNLTKGSLMARVAVEKGAQYREAEAVNLETVPKLFDRQANIPFDLQRDAHYAVTVRHGKIYRHSLSYASMPHEDSMIPCLAHQV